MANQMQGVVPYPFDAQSSPFFCALASALIPALGLTDETPFFCVQKNTRCLNCGNCGSKTTLQKHHLQLYHNYQTFTGVGLGWDQPENDSKYQVVPGWEKGWSYPDAFLGFIFGFAGLSWKRVTKGAGEREAAAAIAASVDAGLPVLLRFGQNWRVATGYDGAEIIGLGYGATEAAAIPNWFGGFDDAVIITGRARQSVSYADVLYRMIESLAHPAHARLEADLMKRLDEVAEGNVQATAEWLLEKVGFPIEARWHAADSEIYVLCESEAAKEKIFGMIRQYVFDSDHDATHGTCWKIWAKLGVGPKTNYRLPPNAAELLLKPETRSELKRLFTIVFENDRVVLGLLRGAAEIINNTDAAD
ncbi:MAG: hypothetical protein FWF03_00690 [Defluviitaleaceae bacterium]|nr:hypothetical protein [Defluviitaleaceae bacterium]